MVAAGPFCVAATAAAGGHCLAIGWHLDRKEAIRAITNALCAFRPEPAVSRLRCLPRSHLPVLLRLRTTVISMERVTVVALAVASEFAYRLVLAAL